jgi:adenylyl-sulfate kinase
MRQSGAVDRRARLARNGHGGAVVWLTGLPAAGKSTIARELELALFRLNAQVYWLDGDDMRRGLCRDLGFSPEDRAENIRRAGEVAALFADAGTIVIASFISPYRQQRAGAREAAAPALFVEVFVDCPLEECMRRDPKGLYQRAQRGELAQLTGVGAPYEPPESPEVHLHTDRLSVDEAVARVLAHLQASGVLSGLSSE